MIHLYSVKKCKVLVYINEINSPLFRRKNDMCILYHYMKTFMITTARFWECNHAWNSGSVHSILRLVYPQHKNVL